MLENKELKALVDLRTRLLHYWQKFPEPGEEKTALNDWQNVLDKVILQEQKKVDYSVGQNGQV